MTIQGFRQQTRGGGFANPARARKEIGVMKPLVLNGVAQSARYRLLPRDFIKSLRAPFACNYLVGHKKEG
jgi:hypothetical protein